MSKKKYKTVFSLFDYSKKEKKTAFWCFSTLSVVLLATYFLTSFIPIIKGDDSVPNILLKISEISLSAVSIVISIMVVFVSNLYSKKTTNLLQKIIERNEPLGLGGIKKIDYKKTSVTGILFIINIVLILLLFLTTSILQIIAISTECGIQLGNIISVLVFSLNISLISLNVLSIIDCIISFNDYKRTINDIDTINKKIFDEYNIILIDYHKK